MKENGKNILNGMNKRDKVDREREREGGEEEGTEPEFELDLWEGQFSLTDSTTMSNSTQSLSTSTHVGSMCSSLVKIFEFELNQFQKC